MKKPILNLLPEITQKWSIERIVKESNFHDWNNTFKNAKHEIKQISDIMEKERSLYKMYPLQKDIFNIFHRVPLHKVRVVILNNCPYDFVSMDGLPVADGIALSCERIGMTETFMNIFLELRRCYPESVDMNFTGSVKGWLDQGVLLLDASLTTIEEKRNKYKDVWRGFTRKVIRSIIEYDDDIPFLLLGKDAQSYSDVIGNSNPIVEGPSPHSSKQFQECNVFVEINEILKKNKKEEIDWTRIQ
jgi:uracil-DNA glycosylase